MCIINNKILQNLIEFFVITLLACSIFFGSQKQFAALNKNMNDVDQSAYMNFAIKANSSNYSYLGGRNRMPLYPFLQSFFTYEDGMSHQELFEQGSILNIYITVVFFVSLAFFIKYFGAISLLLRLVIFNLTASMLMLKAPYFQVEILYYSLFFSVLVLACSILKKNNFLKSLILSILLVLFFYSKASSSILILLTLSAIIIKNNIIPIFTKKLHASIYKNLLQTFLIISIFASFITPYLMENKAKYGRYIYNISMFYAWYDSWEEAMQGTRATGDREAWPDMPQSEIPSMQKYFNEHGFVDIIERFYKGTKYSINHISQAYGFLKFYLFLFAVLAVLYAQNRNKISMDSGFFFQAFFITSVIAAYFFSISWWNAGAGGGARHMLAIAIPVLYFLCKIISYIQIEAEKDKGVDNACIISCRVNIITLAIVALSFFHLYEIYTIKTLTFYGGS